MSVIKLDDEQDQRLIVKIHLHTTRRKIHHLAVAVNEPFPQFSQRCAGTGDLHEIDERTAAPLSLMNLGRRGTRKEAGGEVRKGGRDTKTESVDSDKQIRLNVLKGSVYVLFGHPLLQNYPNAGRFSTFIKGVKHITRTSRKAIMPREKKESDRCQY
jgi:hypothetical protein